MRELLLIAVPALLGGGALTAIVAAWRAKRTTPAEVDSIIVGGAEKAVLVISQALEAEQAAHALTRQERDRLAEENARQLRRVRHLEERLDALQALLDQARADLQALRTGE